VCSMEAVISSRVVFSCFPSVANPPLPPHKLSICPEYELALCSTTEILPRSTQRRALGIAPRPRRYYSEDLYAHYRKHLFHFSFSFLPSFSHTYEPLSVFGTMTTTCNAQDSCQDTQESGDVIVTVRYLYLRCNVALGLFVANANSFLGVG
jgi:hypothetical protein